MRARIKEGWYPYGVGFVVDVFAEFGGIFKIVKVVSGERKNYELCAKKLINKILPIEFLDFNYTNMKDTIKTFRVKIKDTHPNPEMRGLIVHVSLDERLDWGDRYIAETFELKEGNANTNDKYYIMDEYLDFSYGCKLDETDYLLSTEANSEKLEESIKQAENGQTRIYDSGAQRDGDSNKPYTHSIQPYTRLRFGYHMRMGARKYGDKNYLKGFPDDSIIESGDRHWTNIMAGDMSEDNLSAMLFAIQLLMLNQEKRGIKADHWFKREE